MQRVVGVTLWDGAEIDLVISLWEDGTIQIRPEREVDEDKIIEWLKKEYP